MNLQEALKIRAVIPCAELRIARHFARVWKRAAKNGQSFTDDLEQKIGIKRARIAELEQALRHAANTLEDAGLPLSAETCRELVEKR